MLTKIAVTQDPMSEPQMPPNLDTPADTFTAHATGQEPRESEVYPEDNWQQIWHVPCPGDRGFFRRLNKYVALRDHSLLRLLECVKCGARVYAGTDKQHRIVSIPETEVLDGVAAETRLVDDAAENPSEKGSAT